MKTSTKLIAAAIFLLLIALFTYDYLLKQEYLTGSYKIPYKNYTLLKFKDFDAADVLSSTAANVKFVQGPYSVKIDADALSYTSVKQIGNRLVITTTFEGEYRYNPYDYILIISAPNLIEVNTTATYKKNKGAQTVTDTIVREDWHMRQVLIEGFNEDSINVKQNYGSTVVFSNNHIRTLNAIVGASDSSGSKLIIQKNNRINQAGINVLNRSTFLLDGNAIHNLKYNLADSAKITFTGSSQNIINNSKSYQK
jgi:hypothetical protein